MNRVLQVAWREFAATVGTKGFIIGILIVPLLVVLMIFAMTTLFHERAPRIQGEVAVIDPTGEVGEGLRDYLRPEAIAERRDDFQKLVEESTPDEVKAIAGSPASEDARRKALETILGDVPELDVVMLEAGADVERAKDPMRGGRASEGGRLALVVVHDDAVVKDETEERHGDYDLFVKEKLDDRIEREIKEGMRNAIVDARVRDAGLDREYIESLTRVGRVRSVTVTEEGEKQTNEVFNTMLPMAFMLLLYVSVMTGGQSLMTTTVEEKASRVVELLLSAVSPMQLMTGKIVGQMFVGFVTLLVYAGMGVAALVSFAMLGLLDAWALVYLLIFYLITYFIVGSLLAAIGAAVNEIREAQNLMMPVMILLIIPWMLWFVIARDPSSVFSLVTSFVPPINSFVMLIRITSTTPPPWWQIWLSIGVGLASVYGALWFAAKIFRIGLLMYGKPPNFATLIKWVKMA